jgi:hypothetical protein
MGGNDWVEVRLSEFGREYAGDGPVRVHEGPHEFVFKPGETQRVTRAFDWERILKPLAIGGRALFEIVPDQHAEDLVQEWRAEGYAGEVADGRPTIDVPKDENEHGGEK